MTIRLTPQLIASNLNAYAYELHMRLLDNLATPEFIPGGGIAHEELLPGQVQE